MGARHLQALQQSQAGHAQNKKILMAATHVHVLMMVNLVHLNQMERPVQLMRLQAIRPALLKVIVKGFVINPLTVG